MANTYGETNLERVLELYQREKSLAGRFVVSNPCEVRIRILPPIEFDLYYVPFGKHYNLVSVNSAFADFKGGVGCFKLTADQECLACRLSARYFAEMKRLDNTVDPLKQRLAKACRASQRFVVNMVNMEDAKAGVMTWEFGPEVHDKIRGIFAEWKDITKPDAGRVLVCKFTKKDEYTPCTSITVAGNVEPIPVSTWAKDRKDLYAYARASLIDREQFERLLKTPDPTASMTNGHDAPADDPERVAGAPAEIQQEVQPPKSDDDLSNDAEVQTLLARVREERAKKQAASRVAK